MSRNARERKLLKVVRRMAAWGLYSAAAKRWTRPYQPRCTAKAAGRKCWRSPHHGNHRDIRGREWRQVPVQP